MVLISKRVNKHFNIKQSIIICTLFLVKYEYYYYYSNYELTCNFLFDYLNYPACEVCKQF
jgi:hypothetical protein